MDLKDKVKKNGKKVRDNFWVRQLVLALSLVCILVVLAFVFLNKYTRHGKQYSLPDLCGLTLEEAQFKSRDLNLRFQIFDSIYAPDQRKGAILDQYPKPGSIIKKDRAVILTLNTYEPKKAEVPYVAGFSLRHAKNRLITAGMEIGELKYVPDIATNNVIRQYYKDTLITRDNLPVIYVGSPIDLVVGVNETDPVPNVPQLVGLSFKQARDVIWENGFNMGEVSYTSDVDYSNRMEAVVVRQSKMPQIPASFGTRIDIRITTDSATIARSRTEMDRRAKQVNDLRTTIRLQQDTIKWIRSGSTVRLKVGEHIYEYVPEDTLKIQNRIRAAEMKIDSIMNVNR